MVSITVVVKNDTKDSMKKENYGKKSVMNTDAKSKLKWHLPQPKINRVISLRNFWDVSEKQD